jgi:hypothetical protein
VSRPSESELIVPKKSDFVMRWYQTVLVEGRVDQIKRLYAPAPAAECLRRRGTTDPAEIGELVEIIREFLVDIDVTVVHMITDGPWVSSMLRLSSLRADTEEPVSTVWQSIMRIEGEMIVENYNSFDYIPFFEQLGQLPKDAFALLLGGAVFK